jgi:outer membrane protein insertion porin family
VRGGEAKTPTHAWLALALAASVVAGPVARAEEPPPQDQQAVAADAEAEGASEAVLDAGPAPEFVDPVFGPRYVIEAIVVRGNRKTKTPLILEEVGLKPGDAVGASDPRVEAARYRLLALGHFLDARLSVQRGSRRGAVVLLVEVEERGTIVINELYPSTSAATKFWGGVDLSETNFLGRGINLGAGFVASTKPIVRNSDAGLGLRIHGSIPERRGPAGLALGATALYNDGSEFYRQSGADSEPDPGQFTAAVVRRAGGIVGAGHTFGRWHGSVDLRGESVYATLPPLQLRVLPDGGTAPIEFDVRPGRSRLTSVALTLDYDTRSDPILPRSGARVVASVEAGGPATGGQYSFVKTVVQSSLYFKMPRGHALGLHLMGGAIAGDAAYFDQFYVGDLNVLLPRRALGMSFSTQPSRNLLGTSIAGHRYDDYAARVLLEYAIPIWRRRGIVYGADAFAAVGIFGMASDGDLDPPGGLTWSTFPVDLTGDVGFRLDTYVGIFTISIANALSRSSF